jgi:hypothetical protein
MTRPTDAATIKFQSAARSGLTLQQGIHLGNANLNEIGVTVVNVGYAISELAKGMVELSTAIRATYILLEQVQSSISKGPGRNP